VTDTPDEPLVDVEHGEPIPRATVADVCRLLGYRDTEVVHIGIEYRHVRVTTSHVRRPADLRDVVHVHPIT